MSMGPLEHRLKIAHHNIGQRGPTMVAATKSGLWGSIRRDMSLGYNLPTFFPRFQLRVSHSENLVASFPSVASHRMEHGARGPRPGHLPWRSRGGNNVTQGAHHGWGINFVFAPLDQAKEVGTDHARTTTHEAVRYPPLDTACSHFSAGRQPTTGLLLHC